MQSQLKINNCYIINAIVTIPFNVILPNEPRRINSRKLESPCILQITLTNYIMNMYVNTYITMNKGTRTDNRRI